MKPTVQYIDLLFPPKVGTNTMLKPIDHPSNLVTNTRHVHTSEVVKIEENGVFETKNTRYVPATKH